MAEFLERSLDRLNHLSLPSLPSLFTEITGDDPFLLAELNGAACCSVMDSLSPTAGLMDYYFSPFSIDDDCGGELSCFPPASAAAERAIPQFPPPPPPADSAAEQDQYVDRKRKTIAAPETSSRNCAAVYSGAAASASAEVKYKRKNNGWSGGKRPKNTVADSKHGDEKAGDVIHVRARRGQATDSHSLAERVRRRKINERMRCLQDLVPGCYKTMGMAGVLDEIINYVQSLQNQVEFLSMKLSAANSFYDFNPGVESVPTNQVADDYNKADETEMRKLLRARGGCDHVASATSTHHQHQHQHASSSSTKSMHF